MPRIDYWEYRRAVDFAKSLSQRVENKLPFSKTLVGSLGEIGFKSSFNWLSAKQGRNLSLRWKPHFHPHGGGDGGYDYCAGEWTIDVKVHRKGLTVPAAQGADVYAKVRLEVPNGESPYWFCEGVARGWASRHFSLRAEFVGWISKLDLPAGTGLPGGLHLDDRQLDPSLSRLLDFVSSPKTAPAHPRRD